MQQYLSLKHLFFCVLFSLSISFSMAQKDVPLYCVFETKVINSENYTNPYIDTELTVQYQAPSGMLYNFYGFYDGDGEGGSTGNIWKIRFMPNEIGSWKYIYSWSDSAIGGKGSFNCVSEGAGKGILQAYHKNPHWLAYNGTAPIWLKSYYETGHGSIGQDFEWIKEHVYMPLYENGYNHLQVNWLLSLCCFGQYYKDGPKPETLDLALYQEGDLWGTMNQDIWKRMEQHMTWLNDHDMGVHMFLGVDGSRNDGPDWSKLSPEEKDQLAKYMVARLAPYANLAGWNFVWEVPGHREDKELGFARLVAKYDIFGHLRTYEDEFPRENEFNRNEYNFASIENHGIGEEKRELDRNLWKNPWTHHMACLLGYEGKPVFMSEGNALWRRYWHPKAGADQDDLRRAAWACATAGASFTWNGHSSEYELQAGGDNGLPFNDENEYKQSEKAISVLADIMNNEVRFYRMRPHDELLKNHSAVDVYLLSELGEQYLVFAAKGEPFSVKMEVGNYTQVSWIDAKTGKKQKGDGIDIKKEGQMVSLEPPDRNNDWICIIKK